MQAIAAHAGDVGGSTGRASATSGWGVTLETPTGGTFAVQASRGDLLRDQPLFANFAVGVKFITIIIPCVQVFLFGFTGESAPSARKRLRLS